MDKPYPKNREAILRQLKNLGYQVDESEENRPSGLVGSRRSPLIISSKPASSKS